MSKKDKQNKLSSHARKAARQNFEEFYRLLMENYPQAETALEYETPLQLLIATILSAQCTDKRVNMVTPVLFKRFPNAESLADADLEEVEKIVKSTGFFRNKAKNIVAACQKVMVDFGGKLPDTMEELVTLPGVARKTANVVLWSAFGKNEGIVVDTHVGRIAYRLGISESTNPDRIEKDLMEIVPRSEWGVFANMLIDLGRDTCKAPTPKCQGCVMREICPWFKEIVSK